MSNFNWNSIGDEEFDTILSDFLPGLPPEDMVQHVTPWRKPINRILTSLTLSVITLNLWWLNYILPAIGFVLALLGFRALRKENEWFNACFIIIQLRVIYYLTTLILNATIYRSDINDTLNLIPLYTVNFFLQLLWCICLWNGLRSLQQKISMTPHAGGVIGLIVWYTIIALLTFMQYRGYIIALCMLIIYFIIINNLYKLSKEMDAAGYGIEISPQRLSDRAVVAILGIILLVGISCGYLFFHSYSMNWEKVKIDSSEDLTQIKHQLINLGFPDNIIDDLSEDDIRECNGALQVVNDIGTHKKKLLITSTAVKLPNNPEQWKIFHHFLWTSNPGFYGTESIQLVPAYNSGWASRSDVTGHVLYDFDGKSYVAPYKYLGHKTYTSSNFMWGNTSSTDVFASFSMPKKGENHRGYLAYTVEETGDVWIDSWIKYTHQEKWFQYPVMSAMDKSLTNGWNNTKVFYTIHDYLQFYPNVTSD